MKNLISQKKKLTIAIVTGSILLSGTAFLAINNFRSQSSSEMTSIPVEPQIRSVMALGRLEPRGEVIDVAPAPDIGGAKAQEIRVKLGDGVLPNQIVAILDSFETKDQALRLAREEVRVAEANVASVKAGAKQGEIEAQAAAIKTLQSQLAGETQVYLATKAGLERELTAQRQEKSQAIDRLKAELANAEVELERYRRLHQEGAINLSELEQKQLTRDTAQKRLGQEQANLGLELTRLESSLQELEANLYKVGQVLNRQIEEGQANLRRIKEIRPVDIQKAEAELARAKAALGEAEAELELAFIRSPIAGTVLKVNVQPGETINQTEGVIQVGNTDAMVVVAEVYESDIGLIQGGQKVTITSEGGSFAGKLSGEVLTVGRQIAKKDVLDTDPTADVDTRVIEVDILLTPEDSDRVKNLTYSKVITEIHL